MCEAKVSNNGGLFNHFWARKKQGFAVVVGGFSTGKYYELGGSSTKSLYHEGKKKLIGTRLTSPLAFGNVM